MTQDEVHDTMDEKGAIRMIESVPSPGVIGFDDKDTKRLVRKIDKALLPLLTLLYLFSFLDRTNIGNARLAGLETSLDMKGLDYNVSWLVDPKSSLEDIADNSQVALAVFFPFYVLAEIPSNLMMKRTRPSIWIPAIMVAWGITCTLMGLVDNYNGLLAARAALGIAEGGLFPGITY